MIKTLETWLEEDVQKVREKPIKWLSEMYFHRETSFPKKINQNVLYAPASGTIINVQEGIKPKEKMAELKGIHYSLDEMFGDYVDLKEDEEYLVIDIYMSFYDQHFNYTPCSGYRTYEEIDSMRSFNLPMIAMEKELLKGVVNPNLCVDYMHENGRMLNIIDSPKIGELVYVAQISDFDVSKILSYEDYGNHLQQCQRFGKITLGSQCTLFVKKETELYTLEIREDVKVGMHCEATDPLVNIIFKNQE